MGSIPRSGAAQPRREFPLLLLVFRTSEQALVAVLRPARGVPVSALRLPVCRL